jgi:hypothetical protein
MLALEQASPCPNWTEILHLLCEGQSIRAITRVTGDRSSSLVWEAFKITVALQRADIPALSTQVIDIISMSDNGSNLLAGGNWIAPKGSSVSNSAKGRHRVDKAS